MRGAQEGLLGARALGKRGIKEHCYAILITQEFKIRIVVSFRLPLRALAIEAAFRKVIRSPPDGKQRPLLDIADKT